MRLRYLFIMLVVFIFYQPSVGFAYDTTFPATSGNAPAVASVTNTILYDQYLTPAFADRVGVFSDITIATADDFTIPAATTWTITTVDVALDYNDLTGYTNTADVIFYNNAAGSIGSVACSRTSQTVVSLAGLNRQITLDTPCVLGTGTYWLSVTPRFTCASASCGSVRMVSANGQVGLEQQWFNVGSCGAAWGSMSACSAALQASNVFRLRSITNDTLVASAVCNGDNLEVTITDGDEPYLIDAPGTISPSEPVLAATEGAHILQGPDTWGALQVTEQGGDGQIATLGNYTCVNLNGSIIIPAGVPGTTNGSASPYPATTTISGLPPVITDVNLSIVGLGHSFPADVEMLLVSPEGTGMIVMSDMCASYGGRIYNFTFDDEAPTALTNANNCVSGTYRRSVETSASFPSPAPAGPYVTSFAGFDGENPNGVWSLYISDDSINDYGDLESWSLDITADYTDLVTNAVCNGNNLEVTISAGDGTYNITGSGSGLPANGVNAGQIFNGPAVWTGVTVTETTGSDGESIPLGDFACSTTAAGVSSSVAGTADEEGPTSVNASIGLFAPTTAAVNITFTPDGNCSLDTNSLSFDASNWSTNQNLLVTAINDLLVEGTHTCAVGYSTASPYAPYNGLTGTVSVPIADNDTNGIVITPLETPLQANEAGDTASFTARLTSQPTSPVTFTFLSDDTSEGTITTGATLTFAADPTALDPQTVVVTGEDDLLVDGNVVFNVTWSTTSGDSFYDNQSGSQQVTTIDDETANLVVSSVNPFAVNEEGPTSTSYGINLTTQPTADVIVNLTVDAQCSLSTNQLTFTNANWDTAQPITVNAVDDLVAEGDHSCVVNHNTSSTLTAYNGLSENITFVVFDNDATGIIITPNGFIVLEIDQPVYGYTVRLSSSPASGETVTISIPANAQLASLSPNPLTFTNANWNVPQTVSLQALADGITEGITTETLPHTSTSTLGGSAWDGVSANLVLYIYDDEESAPFDVPNLGEIMVTTQQVQQPFDSPGGQPIYLPTGGELFLPADYDGNGFDTYTVTQMTTIGDVTWYGVFVGNRYWVWLPETNVTRVR